MKMYKALVGEVLSVKDAPIDQKNISRITALVKLVVLSIKYTHELNHRVTDIAYGIVTIIKKTHNYRNDQSVINAYYQALRELKKLNKAKTASEIVSVTRSSKGTSILNRIWYNIKNLWKGKKKAEEIEEPEEHFYTSPLPSPTKDLFKEVLLKPVFNPSKWEEELLEFEKRKDKEASSKDLTQFLPKHLWNLLSIREQILKDKRTFQIGYIEETSEILQEFLKKDMIVTEKALAATLKNIGNILNTIEAGLASEPLREYSMTKANYFYGKTGEDVKKWFAKIDWMIEANNIANRRRVAVVAAHLRDVTADWYEADKTNINRYINNNTRSFIRWIKVRFTLDV